MLSANADGLGKKLHSLKHEINETNSKIFTVQETQYRTKGRVKIEEFVIFESIRKNREKGGCMLGIHESLEPVLIEEYSDNFEIIVAEIKVAGKNIRVINAYGPKECWASEEKNAILCSIRVSVIQIKT